MERISLVNRWKEAKRPLILDGATGSLLQESITKNELLWSSSLNVEDPKAVISLHKQYIEAGADIITTNTFRTNPHFYNKYTLNSTLREFVAAGVDIAKIAKGKSNILIAGSNPPAEDCYQAERTISNKELELNHRSHINLLYDYGVDFILNETQSHFDEIKIICKFCDQNKIPFIISLFSTDDNKILSGEDIFDVISYILGYSPIAISINCVTFEVFEKLFPLLPADIPFGFYLNCGTGSNKDKVIKCNVFADKYLELVKNFITSNTLFIGSCCGSDPSHIKSLKAYLDEQN